jgi:cytochrome c peroxidase
MHVSGVPGDQYRFRTTPLRNVELTGPYSHAGQFASPRAFIDQYSESDVKLRNYDPNRLEPLLRGTLLNNADAILATRNTILNGVVIPPPDGAFRRTLRHPPTPFTGSAWCAR